MIYRAAANEHSRSLAVAGAASTRRGFIIRWVESELRDERDGYDPNRFARVREVTTRIGSVLSRSLAKVDRELTLIAAVRTNRLQDRRLNRRCGRRRSDRDKNGLSSIGAVRGFMFGVQMLFISATLGTTYP